MFYVYNGYLSTMSFNDEEPVYRIDEFETMEQVEKFRVEFFDFDPDTTCSVIFRVFQNELKSISFDDRVGCDISDIHTG